MAILTKSCGEGGFDYVCPVPSETELNWIEEDGDGEDEPDLDTGEHDDTKT